MRKRTSKTSRLSVILTIAAIALAWVDSASGRLSIAAITERGHRLTVRLADGHLDLIREHSHSSPGIAASEEPVAPDHVVHLCEHDDAITAKNAVPAKGGALPPSIAPLADSAIRSRRSISSIAPSTAPPSLLTVRTTVLLV